MNPALAYHDYLGPAMFVPSSRITLAVAAIQPHERVLDVACGTGIVTSQVRAARVVGLDLDPRMLEVAAKTTGVEWMRGDATRMELPSGAFDVVLCQHGLQFFRDRAAGARELHRVCAQRAVVACWQSLEHQSCFGDVVHAQAKHLGISVAAAATPFSFGDPTALRTLLAGAGFAKVDVQEHAIEARFPDPARFIRMCVGAAMAVMPERFGGIDPEALTATVSADVSDALRRHTVGDSLVIPMRLNVALAFV